MRERDCCACGDGTGCVADDSMGPAARWGSAALRVLAGTGVRVALMGTALARERVGAANVACLVLVAALLK